MANFIVNFRKNLNVTPALIFAAGRGERMRPLTDHTPKPLLMVNDKPLMQHMVERLIAVGFVNILTNTAWLGEQIESHFADALRYSHEAIDFGHSLETAGGVVRALPLLELFSSSPVEGNTHVVDRKHHLFWGIAGDVWAPDFSFDTQTVMRFADSTNLAHIWVIPNPQHHPKGDFLFAGKMHTFCGIALYKMALFTSPWCEIPHGNPNGVASPLAPLLKVAMQQQRLGMSLYTGKWADIGTPARLAEIQSNT